MNKTFNEIKEFLRNELYDSDILSIWNDIAIYDGSVTELISMDYLDDFFCDTKVSRFLELIDRDFDLRDDYFYDDCYGISSTSDIYDIVDLDELAYILEDSFERYENYINCDELIEFMNSEDEDDEEDFEEEELDEIDLEMLEEEAE